MKLLRPRRWALVGLLAVVIVGVWAGLATWMSVRAATSHARFRGQEWTVIATT